MHNMLRITTVMLILANFAITGAQAQQEEEKTYNRSQLDSMLKTITDFFDEVLDIELARAALQARHISNVGYGLDNRIGLNGELRDTLEFLREVIQSELFVKSALQYDHFWPNLFNRTQYSPKKAELEKQHGAIYSNNLFIDIVFKPAWDTTAMDSDAARKAGLTAYTCKIKVSGVGIFSAKLTEKELATALNQATEDKKYGSIKREAKPDVNAGLYAGLGWLAEKFGFEPHVDPMNIERVGFYVPEKQEYGYDAYEDAILSGNYGQVSVKGKQYYVPWKSVAVGNPDYIFARVIKKEQGKPAGTKIIFTTTTGTTVTGITQVNDTTYKILLPGTGLGETGLIGSYQYTDNEGKKQEVIAGQANIAGYAVQEMQLVLVPVNGNTAITGGSLPAIAIAINAIYAQAATKWTVRLADNLKVPEVDESNLDNGNTGLLTNYTDDMNAVIDAYHAKTGRIDKNTCYLFLVNKPAGTGNKSGYMPLKRQFGFIFTNNCGNKLPETIAHELGHGPFRLYHTFSGKNDYVQAQGTTNNLMDYTKNPSHLNKYQWDLIHDPESMIFAWAQDEEEGASLVSNLDNLATWNELFPDFSDTELSIMQRVYDTIGSNYDALHGASISQNVVLSGDLDKWSIRKSSHTSADRVESVAKNIATNTSPSYSNVDTNEIYVKKYEYRDLKFMLGQLMDETKSTNVALYSYVDEISFTKTVLENLESLKDETSIKVGSFNFSSNSNSNRTMVIGGGDNNQTSPGAVSTYVALPVIPEYTYDINDYVLIAFCSNEGSNPDFVFQLIPEESESEYEVAAWLTHIGVLEQESEITLLDGTKLGDPVPNPVITPIAGDTLKGKMGCVRTSRNNCDNSYSNYTTNSYDEDVRIQKHTGIDITTEVGTNVHAIYGGKVHSVVSSFELRDDTYSQEPTLDVQGNSSWERIQGNADTIGNYNYYSIISYETEDDTVNNLAVKRGFYGCHYVGRTVTGTDKTALGNYVIIETTNLVGDTVNTITGAEVTTLYITYGHMNEVKVSKGEVIPRGGIIGTSGCSGNAARIQPERYHIHIQAGSTPWGKNVDPIYLINTQLE